MKEVEIESLFAPGKPASHDLRLRVVNRAADQVIPAVLKRNNVPILRFPEGFQDFAGKNPVVPMENASARFDDKAGHNATSLNDE